MVVAPFLIRWHVIDYDLGFTLFPVHVANNDGVMTAVLVVVPSSVLSLFIFLAVIRYF